MSRIRLIHWNEEEAPERAARIRSAGYEVSFGAFTDQTWKKLRENPPAAVVIDLSRLPSHGRDVALGFRTYRSTRHVPIVFVGGDPEKVANIKEILPDAVYTSWNRIRSSLREAITNPPEDPVVPKSLLEGYSGTPLPKKLGIKAGSVVILAGAPTGFEKILVDLPENVTLRRQARGNCDLAIWFVKSRKNLEQRIERMGSLAGKDGLWIVWPKKTSGVTSDLTQTVVREVGLAAGLVDYKVCSVDDTWSGLRFALKKSD